MTDAPMTIYRLHKLMKSVLNRKFMFPSFEYVNQKESVFFMAPRDWKRELLQDDSTMSFRWCINRDMEKDMYDKDRCQFSGHEIIFTSSVDKLTLFIGTEITSNKEE